MYLKAAQGGLDAKSKRAWSWLLRPAGAAAATTASAMRVQRAVLMKEGMNKRMMDG